MGRFWLDGYLGTLRRHRQGPDFRRVVRLECVALQLATLV